VSAQKFADRSAANGGPNGRASPGARQTNFGYHSRFEVVVLVDYNGKIMHPSNRLATITAAIEAHDWAR
jgi:hypothetical protein